ncbi:MAG: T9SS type A sorting domain-containing protein [Bacteroidota bacterium]
MKKVLSLILLGLTALATQGQQVIYVDHSASGADDGSNWADAYRSLDNALDNVTQGVQVWVAGGIYSPDGNDRSASFDWNQDSVAVYGGFAGTETTLNQRDHQANVTILSGAINSSQDTDNCYTVVKGPTFVSDPITYAKLDGFGIHFGYADVSSGLGETDSGGGIYVDRRIDRYDIENCHFFRNRAAEGGAMYIQSSTTTMKLNLINCKFTRNESGTGAAIYARVLGNPSASGLDVNMVGCEFSDNRIENTFGTGWTGMVYLETFSNADMSLYNCTFANNVDPGAAASDDATVSLWGDGNGATAVKIYNSIFWGNQPNTEVGQRNGSSNFDSLVVENCIAETPAFQTGTITTNILALDPLFVDALNGDFDLQASSPAINMGHQALLGGLLPTIDLLGRPRIFGPDVDLGAYENQAPLAMLENAPTQILHLYPNPATDFVRWKPLSGVQNITLTDALGRIIQVPGHLSLNRLSTTHLAPGTYFLRITTHDHIQTQRFVKR